MCLHRHQLICISLSKICTYFHRNDKTFPYWASSVSLVILSVMNYEPKLHIYLITKTLFFAYRLKHVQFTLSMLWKNIIDQLISHTHLFLRHVYKHFCTAGWKGHDTFVYDPFITRSSWARMLALQFALCARISMFYLAILKFKW